MIKVDGRTFLKIYNDMLQVESTSMHPVVFKYEDQHKVQYVLQNDAVSVLYEFDAVTFPPNGDEMRIFESVFKYIYVAVEEFEDD